MIAKVATPPPKPRRRRGVSFLQCSAQGNLGSSYRSEDLYRIAAQGWSCSRRSCCMRRSGSSQQKPSSNYPPPPPPLL